MAKIPSDKTLLVDPETFKPINPGAKRLAVVDQAIELAGLLPEGRERMKLLKSAARFWRTYNCMIFYSVSSMEPAEVQ